MYTYTPLSKIKTVQSVIKYNILTQVTKEVKKKKLYVQEQKQQNPAQTGNKSKACSQFRNKAMKVKLENMLRKERNERKNRFVKLNRGK